MFIFISGCTGGLRNTTSVEVYDLDQDTWTDGVDLPDAKDGPLACVVNKRIYSEKKASMW